MAKKTVTLGTRQPTGLWIARNGDTFVFGWNNSETYTDVDLMITVGQGPKATLTFPYKAGVKDLAANAVSIKFPYTYINAKKQRTVINPTRYVAFKARGIGVVPKDTNKEHYIKKESAWSPNKMFTILPPNVPSISKSVFEDVDNRTMFSWSIGNADAANPRWFLRYRMRVLYQTEGGKLVTGGWTNGPLNRAAYSWSVPESELPTKGFRRRIEVQALGKRSNSKIIAAEHIYSIPNAPKNVTTGTQVQNNTTGITELRVTWDENASYWHPIDITEFMYCIASPAKGMVAPNNLDGTVVTTIDPRSKSGVYDAKAKAYKPNTNDAHVRIEKVLEPNECLFYRIRNKHDNKINSTKWFICDKLGKVLSTPVINEVTPSQSDTHYYTVTATNTAADSIPDAFLAIYYRAIYSDGTNSDPIIAGIIKNGENSISLALPDDPYSPKDPSKVPVTIGIGVRAYAYAEKYYPITINGGGSGEPTKNQIFDFLKADLYKLVDNQYVPVSSGEVYDSTKTYYANWPITASWFGTDNKLYKTYDVSPTGFNMTSDIIWDNGEIPQAPTNFDIVSTTDGVGVASWDWNWSGATSIELSWSTYADAWISTEEPSTYRVPRINGNIWNIVGLNAGEAYYFRARFVSETNDGEAYGPYTPTKTLNLTSAPLTPVLYLSRNAITEDQDVVASWAYTSADTTPQSKAEIFIVTSDTYGTRYGTYRPAIDKLDKNDQGEYIFDSSKIYYTYSNDVYTQVSNPTEASLGSYFIFDDTTPLVATEDGSTQQSVTLNAANLQLRTGDSYNLALRLTSQSGLTSDWSPAVSLRVVPPLAPPNIPSVAQFIPEIVTLSVTDETDGEEITETRAYLALKALPFTVNISGAGDQGISMVSIERTSSFFTTKPDERTDVGYENEVVALIRKQGDGEITVDQNDLIGYLDDGAKYKLVVTIIDENGQSASSEHATANVTSETFEQYKSILFIRGIYKPAVDVLEKDGKGEPIFDSSKSYYTFTDDVYVRVVNPVASDISDYYMFDNSVNDQYTLVDSNSVFDSSQTYYFKNEFTVNWSHQPVKPEASVETDTRYRAVKITSTLPDGVELVDGDVVDIYRLSADRPQLIVENGIFGETYVDPYPALGEFGGHRIVHKTKNGDYITEDRQYSWIDIGEEEGDYIDTEYSLVNFEEGTVEILYNIDLSSNWKKDFKETRYLGGHIQGDWNPGVSRTGSVNTVSVTTQDQETIRLMRRLADYPGIVHVRTRDGSSYAANIDVSETLNHQPYELVNYSLNITRVDTQELDGLTLEQWNRFIKEGEE